MPIDQADLNNLLTTLFPKDNLTALREKRNDLQKKLEQGTGGNTKKLAAQDKNSTNANNRQVIVELQAADKNLQQAIYEDETRKLEIERLKREAAAAKKMREREKALAKHERVLNNAGMEKLLSAVSKVHQYTTTAGSLSGQGDAIERDLKEAAEFGIAAAQVARRRKDAEEKANSEEAAGNKAKKEKAKKRGINITI